MGSKNTYAIAHRTHGFLSADVFGVLIWCASDECPCTHLSRQDVDRFIDRHGFAPEDVAMVRLACGPTDFDVDEWRRLLFTAGAA